MNSGVAFDYVSPFRGIRAVDRYGDMTETHRLLAAISASQSDQDFMKMFNWKSFQRVSSMAGPLSAKYVVKFVRPLFLYSEAQRQGLKSQAAGKAVPPPAIEAAGGSKSKAGASGAKAAYGKLCRMITSGGRKRHEEDDESVHEWNPAPSEVLASAADLLRQNNPGLRL